MNNKKKKRKCVCAYTIVCYSALKRRKFCHFKTTLMILESISVSEIRKKSIARSHLHMWYVEY
jgi:hypothetical protein